MYFQYLGFCFLMVHLPLAPTAAQSLYEQVKNGLVQEAMGLKMVHCLCIEISTIIEFSPLFLICLGERVIQQRRRLSLAQ